MTNRLMLHKLMLICIKYIPCLLAILYILNNILYIIGIKFVFISCLSYLSIIPIVFILLTSFTFQFCIYHRLPIYYIVGDNLFSYFIYNNIINISIGLMLTLQILALGITVISAAYIKNKYNEHIRDSQS